MDITKIHEILDEQDGVSKQSHFKEEQIALILKNRDYIICTECGEYADDRWGDEEHFVILCKRCGFSFKFDMLQMMVTATPFK